MADFADLSDDELAALESSDAGQKTPPAVRAEQARRAEAEKVTEPAVEVPEATEAV